MRPTVFSASLAKVLPSSTALSALRRRYGLQSGVRARPVQRVILPQGKVHNVLAWIGVCFVLIAAIWAITWVKLNEEYAEISRDALKDASFLTQSYAEQLSRSIEQIDQITLHLRYEWRKSQGNLELAREPEEGFFPLAPTLDAWITDRHGNIVTTSNKSDQGKNIANHAYFRVQQSGQENGLYIGEPTGSYLSGDSVIHFSRRINGPDGSFMGVVVVAAQHDYLESFTSELSLGPNDSVTLKKTEGTILASKRGENILSIPTIYRAPSIFAADKGVARMGEETFVDGEPRIVAWQKLKDYPLMALANLAEKDALKGYRQIERDYQIYAAISSIMLLLFGLVGANYSSRLALKRKQIEDSKQTYRLATEAAREGFFTVKALYSPSKLIEDFIIEDCNDRGANFIGFTKSELVGKKFSNVYANARSQQVFAVFRGAMESGYYEDEIKLPTRDRSKPVWLNRRLVRFQDGLAVTLRDISDAKAHELELAKLANTDVLTLLPNRHWLMAYLPSALEQTKKSHTALALLVIDLDNFKDVNDTLGHGTGDELLKAAAARLQAIVRPGDSVVRLGGDEFTVVSEGYEASANVSPLAERILEALNQPLQLKDGENYYVTASIGISVFPQDGLDSDSLLKHADVAMYAAKSYGKRQYQFYQAHFSEKLVTRLDHERTMRNAIDLDEFILCYQPRVDAMTGELKGLEALLRWQHPRRGLIQPSEFIPFAEETGLIVNLGSLIIEKACLQIKEWKELGLPVVPVSVNVSAKQFNQGNLIPELRSGVASDLIDADLFEIELTESSMLDESGSVFEDLALIKEIGIKMLIDDFGTGFSSLSQLHKLDFDFLKIDKAFTRELRRGHKGVAFFKAMIAMAHALEMRVVAEGVESREQLELLRGLRCDEVQGYYVSKPVIAAQIPELLKRRTLLSGSNLLH